MRHKVANFGEQRRRIKSSNIEPTMPRTRKIPIQNPYESAGTRWLCGETHAHVCKARGSDLRFSNGTKPSKIYRHADKVGLDFVCMSVEVTADQGGVGQFGEVGSGSRCGVTGISAREIQNNRYTGYFTEPGASHLHVLTIGETDGISICAHPMYYETGNPKAGGEWSRIREALLHPDDGGRLRALHVTGIEVYNGFALEWVKRKRRKANYRRYDEDCWDDLLMAGKRCWGFVGNDSFLNGKYEFTDFSHLGLIHVQVDSGTGESDILGAIRAGRFYCSNGVRLACTPFTMAHGRHDSTVHVEAKTRVDWTAIIHERSGRGWRLSESHVRASKRAEFKISGDWKYFRIRCEDIHNRWKRAWLQPVINTAHF